MVTARRLKQKEEVRDSILNAAREIVLKEGWQAVSIRKIADAIGYSLPVVYTHFESKDAILEEFVKVGFSLLNDTIGIAKGKSTTPEQQLTDMAIAYFEFAFAKREYYQMMFGLGMPSCERAKQISEIGDFGTLVITTIQNIHTPLNDEETIMSKRSQTEINRACELLNTDENNNQTVKNIAHDSFITDKNKLNTDEKIRLKFHTYWSILHGLTAINMMNMTATPSEMQQLVLQDAVQGFIKNINN